MPEIASPNSNTNRDSTAQLAGVRKHERAVLVVEMSVEMQTRSRVREQLASVTLRK